MPTSNERKMLSSNEALKELIGANVENLLLCRCTTHPGLPQPKYYNTGATGFWGESVVSEPVVGRVYSNELPYEYMLALRTTKRKESLVCNA